MIEQTYSPLIKKKMAHDQPTINHIEYSNMCLNNVLHR